MPEKRLAWDEYFAAQALLIANRSTCKRAKVGAILVKDNKVISTGYNGSVSGTEHCIDHECLVIEGHCVRTLHAEVNAILQGAERGVPKGFYGLCDPFSLSELHETIASGRLPARGLYQPVPNG